MLPDPIIAAGSVSDLAVLASITSPRDEPWSFHVDLVGADWSMAARLAAALSMAG
jgi:hypothetical protein